MAEQVRAESLSPKSRAFGHVQARAWASQVKATPMSASCSYGAFYVLVELRVRKHCRSWQTRHLYLDYL